MKIGKWPVIAVAVVALYAGGKHAAADGGPIATMDVIHGAAHGGTLNCRGLERLWESQGGSPAHAFLAAEIAMAESGGQQYSTDTNGGRSTDRGYWQINDSAWGKLSTYSAAGNARAAIRISHNGTDWSPWVTFTENKYEGQC